MKKLVATACFLAACHAASAQTIPMIKVPNTGLVPASTPTGQQQLISGTVWINGRGGVQGPNWRDNYQIVHDIFSSMGTWSPAGVYTPNIPGGGFGTGTLALTTPPASIDLTYAGLPNPNVLKLADGFAISFCPALSCINSSGDNPGTPNPSFFDHQRANVLFSGATQDDGHSEEQNLAVITTIGTGYHKPYAANTAYSVGDNIAVGNAVYRAVVAGISGANSAPPGTRPTTAQGGSYRVADGSVTWQWINDSAIDAKVGSYFETQVLPGAGSAWGAAFNYHIKTTPLAGMFLPGIEMDYSNDSGTACGLGTTDCTALRLALGGSAITEGLQITGNGTGAANFSSIWALRINGDMIASQSAIEVDAAAPIGLGFGVSGLGGATHSTSSIFDNTTSPSSYISGGKHGNSSFRDVSMSGVAFSAEGTYAVDEFSAQSASSPAGFVSGGTKTLADVVLSAAGPRAIQINGTRSSSDFEDNTNSPAVFNIGGTHSLASYVDVSTSLNAIALNGTYSGAQIVGKGWQVDPNGTIRGFASVSSNYYTYDSNKNLQTGATCTAGVGSAFSVINGIVVHC